MSKITEFVFTHAVASLYTAVIAALYAIPVMWLWNDCLVDAVTIVRPIGFLQAMGIALLCGFLFHSGGSKD